MRKSPDNVFNHRPEQPPSTGTKETHRARIPLTGAETWKLLWFQEALQSMLSDFYTQEELAKHLGLAQNMVSRLLGRGKGSYLNRGIFPRGKGSGDQIRLAEEKIRAWLAACPEEVTAKIRTSMPDEAIMPAGAIKEPTVGTTWQKGGIEADMGPEVNAATEKLISELSGTEEGRACPTDLRGLRIVSRGFDYANLIDFHDSASYPILAWTYTLADVKKLVGTLPIKFWPQVWVLSDSEASGKAAKILKESTGGAVNLRPSLRDHRKILLHSGGTVLIGSANFGHTLNREAMVEIMSESLYREVYQEFVREWSAASDWGFIRDVEAVSAAKGNGQAITV